MKPVCTPLAYVYLLSTLPHAPTLQRASRQAIFTRSSCTLIWRDVASDILIRRGRYAYYSECRVPFPTFQAFEKTMAGLTRVSTNPNIPYAAYSVACFRLCNCDNILLPPLWRILFPRGSSARVANEASWRKLSRRRASCRYPTYAYTPAGICGPCV